MAFYFGFVLIVPNCNPVTIIIYKLDSGLVIEAIAVVVWYM